MLVRSGNGDVERVWGRTGWSRKELARRVNRRGQSRGLRLNTDASRVAAWFAGQQPQPPVPAILCELFSEHFGYLVPPEAIGLTADADIDVGLRYEPSLGATVAVVADLGRNDVYRRNFLYGAPFVAVAVVAPSRDWLLATLDATTPRPGGKVDHEQVTAIREAFDAYQEADVMRGGGHARYALAQYVTGHVMPLVRDADPETDTGASLFAAASQHVYLLG
ncbi:MAG: transcriptional regulator, partial [Actinomycetota bacterium]